MKLNKQNKISSELLNIMCCPACKSSLKINKNKSMLKCSKCKKSYFIREGVPYMIVKDD